MDTPNLKHFPFDQNTFNEKRTFTFRVIITNKFNGSLKRQLEFKYFKPHKSLPFKLKLTTVYGLKAVLIQGIN